MLIVLLILAALMTFIGVVIVGDYETELVGAILIIIGTITVGCVIVAILVNANIVVSSRHMDEKIALYQEENSKIEEQMEITVNAYMEHETEVFESVKGEDSMTLVSLYPELKSDALVSQQIETYQKNNDKIKSLKNKKIEAKAAKWWLYFGGGK